MFDKAKHFYQNLMEDKAILRCVFGVTLAIVISTSMEYLVPQLAAIMALMFLEPFKKPLGFKMEVGMVAVFSLLGYFGLLIGYYLIDYPLVVLPIIGLAIFWSFRFIKIPEPVRLMFLILAVLIPFLCMKASILGDVVLFALLLNLITALIVVRIAFFLFPINSDTHIEPEAKKPIIYKNIDYDKLAFNGLLVVFPLVFVFYLFNANIAILTLVFAVLLGFDPFIYQSKKGIGLIMANVVGGTMGILAYNILVIAPSFLLYILLIICVAFFFVLNLFAGKKTAPIFKIGFNTFFVVMGVISTSTNEAGNTMWERLLQIGLAVVYIVIAYKVVNTLNNPKLVNE